MGGIKEHKKPLELFSETRKLEIRASGGLAAFHKYIPLVNNPIAFQKTGTCLTKEQGQTVCSITLQSDLNIRSYQKFCRSKPKATRLMLAPLATSKKHSLKGLLTPSSRILVSGIALKY